jgi:hypothetical protein
VDHKDSTPFDSRFVHKNRPRTLPSREIPIESGSDSLSSRVPLCVPSLTHTPGCVLGSIAIKKTLSRWAVSCLGKEDPGGYPGRVLMSRTRVAIWEPAGFAKARNVKDREMADRHSFRTRSLQELPGRYHPFVSAGSSRNISGPTHQRPLAPPPDELPPPKPELPPEELENDEEEELDDHEEDAWLELLQSSSSRRTSCGVL